MAIKKGMTHAMIHDMHMDWFDMWMSGIDPLKAYKTVYPDANHKTAKKETYRLKKRYAQKQFDHVKDEISHGSKRALIELNKLIVSETVTDAVRLKAITALLNFAGFAPVEKKEITVAERTEEEINNRLKALVGAESESRVN